MKISLKAARVNKGLTQADVAKKIDVDPSTICKWEAGRSFPNVFQFQNLCSLYGTTADDIFLHKKSS